MTYQAVIVEDEPLARKTLSSFIAETAWLECAGQATNGKQAIDLIEQSQPDVIFLDVKMPELSGLEVLRRLQHKPAVVFTTAFDQYAVSAFELEAVDYLIKPFGRRRFQNTLARLLRALKAGECCEGRPNPAVAMQGAGKLDRFFVQKGQQMVPIHSKSIVRIESCGDYANIHAGNENYLLHLTLEELQLRLDPEQFCRVHRSHLINLEHVTSLRPYDPRRLVITFRDGSQLVASRHGSRALHKFVP
jgi:two-component system LytT family response regulator